MSGAVNAVTKVVQGGYNDTVGGLKAATNLWTGGLFDKQLGQEHKSIGAQFGNIVGVGNDNGGTAEKFGILPKKPDLPNVAPQDPQKAADDAAAARAAAARQEQISTLTNKPGRGGTILTDQYQYKV